MKVICIDNSDEKYNGKWSIYLTKDKIYELAYENAFGYFIYDNRNRIGGYHKWRFKLLNDLRKEKLQKLNASI